MNYNENRKYRCYASCSFGLETLVKLELENLGIENIKATDARVYFDATQDELARVNLWSRVADRIYLVVGDFEAKDFDTLYEGIAAIDWSEYLDRESSFPVNGDAVKSTLMSVSDIQSIAKKAIVDCLSKKYRVSFFKENGAEVLVYVSIIMDRVTVAINTSGPGLNRRGYRIKNSRAPLRETLASGIIGISRWRDRPFYDTFCGSGTIVIEAAMKAKNMAPGIRRRFSMERWNQDITVVFGALREEANEAIVEKLGIEIHASDIDPKMAEMTMFHAKRAGVEDIIDISVADARSYSFNRNENITLISNPPYAIRMGELKETQRLYKSLGANLSNYNNIRMYFICADENFPGLFGMKEDAQRKLYNGNIKCYLYQYFKNRGVKENK